MLMCDLLQFHDLMYNQLQKEMFFIRTLLLLLNVIFFSDNEYLNLTLTKNF